MFDTGRLSIKAAHLEVSWAPGWQAHLRGDDLSRTLADARSILRPKVAGEMVGLNLLPITDCTMTGDHLQLHFSLCTSHAVILILSLYGTPALLFYLSDLLLAE